MSSKIRTLPSKIRTFVEDEQLGKNAEIALKERISNYFNDVLVHVENKYSKYDFQGKINRYELKNRFIYSDAYSTTMMPVSKKGPNTYFLFHFLDGKLFYIKYDKDEFKNILVDKFGRAPRPDHTDIIKNYFYIPMDRLTEIKK